MQITSHTIQSAIAFYKSELADIYSESELQNIINWVFEKQLKLSPTDIVSKRETSINLADIKELEKMCQELKAHKPIQYVLGEAEFYHLKLKVNESVLIPRPETEELVEIIIKKFNTQHSILNILDIGTGSGCIPIAIKKNIPYTNIFALDISKDALEIAKYNAAQNSVEVNFFQADVLLENIAETILKQTGNQKLDLIISNPPYVLESERENLQNRVKDYEPRLALFVNNDDPILFYRKIAALTKKVGLGNTSLYFECHANYAKLTCNMLTEENFSNICLLNDLGGLNRFVNACL
jgi:release factor glutamine methyltransferase